MKVVQWTTLYNGNKIFNIEILLKVRLSSSTWKFSGKRMQTIRVLLNFSKNLYGKYYDENIQMKTIELTIHE